ncbi:MAG TPA: hypothetical protein PKA27_09020 [Fimbriimonadaceae bacterium]|nr:hypothetical protein [Fimbriimonadaceae bacterium]
MRLKILTTISVLASVGMLVAWPWVIGPQPEGRKARLEWILKASEYFVILLLVLFLTVVFAWLLARRQREEYQKEKLANLQDLIEGTLRDHGRDS